MTMEHEKCNCHGRSLLRCPNNGNDSKGGPAQGPDAGEKVNTLVNLNYVWTLIMLSQKASKNGPESWDQVWKRTDGRMGVLNGIV